MKPYKRVDWRTGSSTKNKDDFVRALENNNDGSTIHGDTDALTRVVVNDIPALEKQTTSAAAFFMERNAANNQAAYAKLGLEIPAVGDDVTGALRAVADVLSRDMPISTSVNDVFQSIMYLGRAVKVSKTLRESLQSYRSRLHMPPLQDLPKAPKVPKETVDVLNALKKRRKEHEAAVGAMLSDSNGYFLSLGQAKELKPMLSALKSKMEPDSMPVEWRTKIGFAFREVLDKGDDASSLSRLIVMRAKKQGDEALWGNVPPRGVSDYSVHGVDPQEAERIVNEYRRSGAYNTVGNLPTKPYTQAYFH